VEKGLSFDAIENGDLEYIAEAALTPETRLGYGEYRVTASHDTGTATRPEVTSISASFDQDLGEKLGGFLRYSYAPDTFRSFEERLALGLVVKQPFGFREDHVGVGGWWGKPSDAALNDETGIEAFYRAQVSRALQITPDLQVTFDPAQSESDAVAVLGLRLRLEL
jgi:porin